MKELKGANMDIDLDSPDVSWEQDKCPWNEADGGCHKCATKGVSMCDYFKGIKARGSEGEDAEDFDCVLCSWSEKD